MSAQYSEESYRISDLYVRCSRTCQYEFSQVEEDELREDYRAIMRRPTWKEELLAVAQTLVNQELETLRKNRDDESVPTYPQLSTFHVVYRGKTFRFADAGRPALFIGRRPGCDVLLRQRSPPWRCSRLHAVVFLLPNDSVIVADVGSYHGIATAWCSTPDKCNLRSLPGKRRLLVFNAQENVRLTLGSEDVGLQGLASLSEGRRHRLPRLSREYLKPAFDVVCNFWRCKRNYYSAMPKAEPSEGTISQML